MSDCCCSTIQMTGKDVLAKCDAARKSVFAYRKAFNEAWLDQLAKELSEKSRRKRSFFRKPRPRTFTREEAKEFFKANNRTSYGFARWYSYPSNTFEDSVNKC